MKNRKKTSGLRTRLSTPPGALCGLCGKKGKLTKTECCDNWICDDEAKYVLFSYTRNSCHRNHRRFTLCGYHHAERHSGHWKDCSKCKEAFETEIYVYYATNEYNFQKLENPPAYEPTKCDKCGTIIVLSNGGYSIRGDKYWCGKCTDKEMKTEMRRTRRST